jgi:hypothetical protein
LTVKFVSHEHVGHALDVRTSGTQEDVTFNSLTTTEKIQSTFSQFSRLRCTSFRVKDKAEFLDFYNKMESKKAYKT